MEALAILAQGLFCAADLRSFRSQFAVGLLLLARMSAPRPSPPWAFSPGPSASPSRASSFVQESMDLSSSVRECQVLRREYEQIRERTRLVHGPCALTAELYYAGLNLALKEGAVAIKKKEMEEKEEEAAAKKKKKETETKTETETETEIEQ